MTTLVTLKRTTSHDILDLRSRDPLAWLRNGCVRLHRRYDAWRQQRHLIGLSDHLLRDIGISRADLAHGVPTRRHN
jgi:hypothetical protein